jgi:hypothetical protein
MTPQASASSSGCAATSINRESDVKNGADGEGFIQK